MANVIIDIGNTRVKLSAFAGDEILDNLAIDSLDGGAVSDFANRFHSNRAVVSTVIDLSPEDRDMLKGVFGDVLFVDGATPLPICSLYETPQTIGVDRIAAAVGANALFPNRDVLVVDAGTAITFEYIAASNTYLGGNIAPGIATRYRSLHQFTGKLPLLRFSDDCKDVGTSTVSAITAGVQRGILLEVSGYIQEFLALNPSGVIIITGGDAFFFEKNLKYTIFVEPFLVQKGLNRILNYNAIVS